MSGKAEMLKPLQEHSTKAELVYKYLVDAIVGNEIIHGRTKLAG